MVVADLRARQRRARTRATTSSTARCSSRSIYVSDAALGLRAASPARCCALAGYRRRAILVGSGKQIDDVAHALPTRCTRRSSWSATSRSTPRPDNGLRSLGTLAELPQVLDAHRVAGGDHRRPGLPAGAGGRARRRLPPARASTVRIAPSTMEILIHRARVRPGQRRAAVRAAPAGLRRLRLRAQAHVRLRRAR